MTGERRIEHLPLDDIQPAPHNPRDHNVPGLKGAIARFGYVAPALRDERTGRLVVGHGRTLALKAMRDDGETPPAGVTVDEAGRWLVPVVCGWASRSDAEAAAYLVADNRQSELAHWEQQGLADLLSEINTIDPGLMDAAGYDQDDLDNLLERLQPDDPDALAGEGSDPDPSNAWPTIRISRVPPHVAAAWRECLSLHGDDEVVAIAYLLQVDPEPPAGSGWRP